jgi:S-DNA-T family DNA segregation ATPase FtsK/SpoIIIE
MVAPGQLRSVTAPRVPEGPPARRFPLIATLAPVVASVVLFAVTRSAFTLVFALLGPVVAISTTADSALQRRRSRKRDAGRLDREFAEVDADVDAAHAAERSELDRRHPRALGLVAERDGGHWREEASATIVRLGAGERASALEFRSPDTASGDVRLASLRTRAARLAGAPVSGDAASGIGFVGPAVVTAAAARGAILQLAARLSPERVRVEAPADAAWDWLGELPHTIVRNSPPGVVGFAGGGAGTAASTSATVAIAESRLPLPRDVRLLVELRGDGTAVTESGSAPFRAEFVSLESAWAAARTLRSSAERNGLGGGAELPESVELSDLAEATPATGLSALIGVAEDGPLGVDLASDGPHAIVGGTTGSGKSELLVSWVLAMAAERSPEQVTFLFVDFKGGAAFDPLLHLPHCAGLITDLDAEQSLRALVSLGAELRHRERELAQRSLRSIDDRRDDPPFPRLVVVVDEYAALVETHSSLHSVFADIAARGRSLGIHLVLCTQRPAGVVRDSILANCALRISLRVMTAADSSAVIGTDAAAALPARPIGRALVAIAGEPPRPFQVARSQAADGERVATRWSASARPRTPWLPPLPDRIDLSRRLEMSPDDGIPFALADLPELQAQKSARYRPAEHGSLLVVGAARSGKSGVLAALAAAPSTLDVELLPRELPQLWDALQAVREARVPAERLLLLDDLDAIIAGCDENYRSALVDLIAGLVRDAPGIHLAFAVQRVSGALQPLLGLCGSLLVLRMPNRQEHILVGGAAAEYSETLPPGGGHWRGHRVQVFATERVRSALPPARATVLDLATASINVVSTRPQQFAEQIRSLAPTRRVVVLGAARFDGQTDGLEISTGGAPDILVADPDTWQSQWSLLATLQRTSDLVFEGCSLTELRAIARSRELPPPIARGARALWLRPREGEIVRARMPAEDRP